jgi:Family of unknown function (DUF6152)
MKPRLVTSVVGAVLSLTICASMFAHHGTSASYEMDKTVTLMGTVTQFLWSNPHCGIFFDVKDEQGNVVHWTVESLPPAMLKPAGWTKESLKEGDQITVTVNPSKAGTPVGNLVKIVFPNGKMWTGGPGAGRQQQ